MASTIAIIGTGRVGTTTAYTLILQNLATHIILLDADKKRCTGESIDLSDSLAFSRCTSVSCGCYQDLSKADIIIIAAGQAQKDASQTRNELARNNKKIIASICAQFPPLQKHCSIIIVTNPVDLMTRVAQTQLPHHPRPQIFGTGTWLDTQRLRRIISDKTSVAPESVQAFVIGEHGDHQIVAWKHANIGGIPVKEWDIFPAEQEKIAEKTRTTVYEIIEKKQATFFGIASCLGDICSAIIFDEKRILPLSWSPSPTIPPLSQPVILGRRGIQQQLTIPLEAIEQKRLHESIKQLDSAWKDLVSETNGHSLI
ncbi:MAG: L-lactate dehydrogenase [candidate division TM6 bacterium GW2011_GWF2_43_17]|nr:MAG: L-lactate dehydrogenase [candidate division TM6 bacterium GW2011_GWF2_43_17]HAU30418.1 hypothetical protein [Candidatus Dependentiae bacterium]